MMVRIKDAEHSQTVAEMRQRIAELEIEVRNERSKMFGPSYAENVMFG